jgi:hypothetical protein
MYGTMLCSGSWKFIPDHDFDYYPSRILTFIHPGSRIQLQQQKRRGKNLLSYLFCSHKYPKIENNFIFEQVKKFFLANSLRTSAIVLFTQNIFTQNMSLRSGIPDRRSAIWGKPIPIPDPEVKKAPDPGTATMVYRAMF